METDNVIDASGAFNRRRKRFEDSEYIRAVAKIHGISITDFQIERAVDIMQKKEASEGIEK